MKRTLIIAVAVAVVLVGGITLIVGLKGFGARTAATAEKPAPRYHCPMHPTYTSDEPGDCPICGMKLVPIDEGSGSAGAPTAEPATASGVSGRAVVTISPDRRQALGVRSEPVKMERLERRIRTVGRVAIDERRLHHVHTRFEGYVEQLYVDYTGQLVRRGQRLLSIYSPELVATQQEYLLALRGQKHLEGSAVRSAAQGSLDLLEAARQRLLLWEIRPADIDRLERSGQVRRTLDIHSHIAGYVVEKMAVQGMRVTPTDTLYDIADLSHLWVLADVYEHDLSSLTLGTEGRVSVAAVHDKEWRGKVTYIAPTLEEKTRTVKVRLEVENSGGELKPDMFADVFLQVDRGLGLVVPDGAVINAGDRSLVFLDRGEGRFEPREVRLGVKTSGGVQVISGVSEGDRVVTAANFLLDSESSLKAALSGMPSSENEPAASPSPDSRAHQH